LSLPSDPVKKRLHARRSGELSATWTIDVNGQHPVRVTSTMNDRTPSGRPMTLAVFSEQPIGQHNPWRVAIDESSGGYLANRSR
jgi:hypothetical protein